IVGNRCGVHLPLPGECFKRVGPWLRGAHFEHRLQFRARLLAAIDRTAMERTGAAGGACHSAMELELEDLREEIARVRRVGRYVILRARIEELFTSRRRRGDT